MNHRGQFDVVRGAHRIGLRHPIAVAGLTLGLLAHAAAAQAQISVATGNGSGAPGGAASVTMTLTGGDDKAALVGFDVVFDTNLLTIDVPDCVLAPRLVATHSPLQVFFPQPGRLRIGVFDLSFPIATFADGDLATCTFHIAANAPLGTTELKMENLEVSDNSAPPVVLPSTPVGGEIAIELVSPTPTSTITPTPGTPTDTPTGTPTNTPVTPATNTPTGTATRTPTSPVPPTNTATATATRTNTPPPAPTNTGVPFVGGGGGGCTIAASGGTQTSSLLWLIVPAALWWRRRRSG